MLKGLHQYTDYNKILASIVTACSTVTNCHMSLKNKTIQCVQLTTETVKN